MEKETISLIVEKQREFFKTGATLSIETRILYLEKLKNEIKKNEKRIEDALAKDLGKSKLEGYMCEVGLALSELDFMRKHIRSYTKEKTVFTPLAQFAARSYKKPGPYGVTLIMSPWNYPFLLTIDPIIDAIAAGNTAVVKPSAYSPATSQIMKEIIEQVFPEEYVTIILGGREENNFLLDEKFDYIFFTGSKTVGKLVLEKASRHLTPVTLELGGKSPCIVDSSAKLKLAARRIVFGKYINCGQTCVAPDYVLCHQSVKKEFIAYLKEEIRKQYGTEPLKNESYGKIVNKKHFERVFRLINQKKVAAGGKADEDSLRIEPTILENVTFEDAVMKEEIFGPILPILTYDKIEEVIDIVNSNEKPLALYIFSENKALIKKVTSECIFGGGCVNDVIIHLATSYMGFGGVGESGMGSYHGKAGFDTFSHYKSIVDKKTFIDLPMRYQPYNALKERLIKMFLK